MSSTSVCCSSTHAKRRMGNSAPAPSRCSRSGLERDRRGTSRSSARAATHLKHLSQRFGRPGQDFRLSRPVEALVLRIRAEKPGSPRQLLTSIGLSKTSGLTRSLSPPATTATPPWFAVPSRPGSTCLSRNLLPCGRKRSMRSNPSSRLWRTGHFSWSASTGGFPPTLCASRSYSPVRRGQRHWSTP